MNTSPIKLQRGMNRQLQTWRDTVSGRGHRLGWKIGFNMTADQQRLNLPSAMVGFLSRERSIVPGGSHRASADAVLLIEPEIAVLIGCDVPAGAGPEQARAAIAAYAAALELVDTTRSADDDMEEILAGNLFHEGVMLAAQHVPANAYKRAQLSISLCINGNEIRTLEQQRVPEDFSTIILDVADILAAHGEQLKSGDWIITGAAARATPVKTGDDITLDMDALGHLRLKIT